VRSGGFLLRSSFFYEKVTQAGVIQADERSRSPARTGFLSQSQSGRMSASCGPQRFANEQRFKVGKPDVIGPAVRTQPDRVRAFVMRAVDKQATARGAHFAEGYLEGGPSGHQRAIMAVSATARR
jgi:hypothetical protein